MATINEKMTGLANAIRSKAGVSGALSIDGMTAAVDGIVINPPSGEGADVSGVTATAADVLNTVKFVDNTGTLQSGTIATIAPTLSDGVVTVPVGYNKTEQTFQVGGGGVDVSGVTATAADVLAGKTFVDSNGTLTDGNIQVAAEPTTIGNVVTIPAGYRSEEEKVTVGKAYEGDTTYTPGTADTILTRGTYIKTMLRIKGDARLTPDNIRYGVSIFDVVGTFTEDGDAEPDDIMDGKVAYVKGKPVYGTYKPQGSSSVDLSFITAEAGDIRSGKVGADANGNPVHGTLVPDSGGSGSGEMQFYVCTGYEGVVEKIIITAGAITDDMGEPVSLIGEYTIVDHTAVGTERRWYCPQTTASGDYPSYTYGVTIGCVNVDTGNFDENDNTIYEKYWAIAPGTNIDEWSYWLSSQTEGLKSPFLVQDWRGYGGTIVTAPVLTSDVIDAAPYGPTGWRGRPIVMTDNPVMVSYGAGLSNCNGFWEQTPSGELTPETQWYMVGSTSMIKVKGTLSEWNQWELNGDFPGNPYGTLYSSQGDTWHIDEVRGPWEFPWSGGASSWNPPPTFVYSETGGYFPGETVVSGLTYAGKPPEIGGFYNADATIKAEKFFPA
jgi:hypothetical protein